MRQLEIPMLRHSIAFGNRLVEACRRFGETPHTFRRRVNWSYRYATGFYQAEAKLFRASPDAYLAGRVDQASRLEDVLSMRLGSRQIVGAIQKAGAHLLFYILGRLFGFRFRRSGPVIWRKGYVDDIDMVYDPGEAGVALSIFPFPLSMRRQFRFLRLLWKQGRLFRLDGNPYSLSDLLYLMLRRDMRSLMRLEARAQIRLAFAVAALGVKTVQVSDEFDLGSLDFCRTLARFRLHVINGSHGSGKYYPMHAYREFRVITRRQAEYYHSRYPCRYLIRRFHENTAVSTSMAEGKTGSSGIRFVFLSQVFAGISKIIHCNESRVVKRLAKEFSGDSGVKLLYRPHPNCENPHVPEGFERLARLEDVNGQPGTLFASFYSTCQVDPAFKGRKVLLRSHLLRPEIAFDDTEEILDLDQLLDLLRHPENLADPKNGRAAGGVMSPVEIPLLRPEMGAQVVNGAQGIA